MSDTASLSSSRSTSSASRKTAPSFNPASYVEPSSPLAALFWRWRMWFESTFVLSMLEPWEKVLLLTIMGLLWGLLLTAVVTYLPHHVAVMAQRASYYLYGAEAPNSSRSFAGVAGKAEL